MASRKGVRYAIVMWLFVDVLWGKLVFARFWMWWVEVDGFVGVQKTARRWKQRVNGGVFIFLRVRQEHGDGGSYGSMDITMLKASHSLASGGAVRNIEVG